MRKAYYYCKPLGVNLMSGAEIRKGELLSFFQFEQLITEHLNASESVSIRAPLLDYQIEECMEVLKVEKVEEGTFTYSVPESSEIESFVQRNLSETPFKGKRFDPLEMRINVENWIRDALLRCGLCEHGNLNEAMRFIKNYDDVIFAPDTNILFDCVFTSVLLPEIEREMDKEPKGCPNWILITIPKLVMNEIERKAVQRFSYKHYPEKAGWPNYAGRIGQRALQEILSLDTDVTRRGLSIMTIGEIPPTYDSFKNDPTRWNSEIRVQIRDFISNISFHKGIFFLTQDRVDAMMARAEGLQSLFLQKPVYEELKSKELKNNDVARVLYEITVTFGEIEIEKLARLSIFWPEKHVSDWEKSKVIVTTDLRQ